MQAPPVADRMGDGAAAMVVEAVAEPDVAFAHRNASSMVYAAAGAPSEQRAGTRRERHSGLSPVSGPPASPACTASDLLSFPSMKAPSKDRLSL